MTEPSAARARACPTIHVFPIGKGHVVGGTDCWCMPRIEPYNATLLVIHNDFPANIKPPRKPS